MMQYLTELVYLHLIYAMLWGKHTLNGSTLTKFHAVTIGVSVACNVHTVTPPGSRTSMDIAS